VTLEAFGRKAAEPVCWARGPRGRHVFRRLSRQRSRLRHIVRDLPVLERER
jgi:hypothetical protein